MGWKAVLGVGRRIDKLKFLEYPLSVEQLLNADDSYVFDVFHRLNTYNYNLSPQELRHGKYHGIFRNTVISSSKRWGFLWDTYNVIGKRARVRMGDDELMAQLLGTILEGVTGGGQRNVERLYKAYDEGMPDYVPGRVDRTMDYIILKFPRDLGNRLGPVATLPDAVCGSRPREVWHPDGRYGG